MFLKVKRAAGKQYFAICESVRRDKKVVTKTIRSLGDKDKAFSVLQSDYPEYLERFYEIVGTKKCRDNVLYGLLQEDGQFLVVYYSGLHYGLPFSYESYEAAEEQRKKFVHPELFTVKELPHD